MGCSQLKFKYRCLSVFLVYNLVFNLLSVINMFRSRNGISTGEISFVNFMVGCTVFKWLMTFKSGSLPCGHIKEMSSLNLFHNFGCRGYVYTYFSSNFVMNKLGYEGSSFLPMAVPAT